MLVTCLERSFDSYGNTGEGWLDSLHLTPLPQKKWKQRHIKAKLWDPSPATRPATPQCRPHRSPIGDSPLPVTGRACAVLLPYRPGVGVTQLLIL